MDPASIAALVLSLIGKAAELGQQIYASSQADLAALGQRVQDALASLAGEKTQAHADLDARWADLQATIAALQAKSAPAAK
jgi:hypothetical protein